MLAALSTMFCIAYLVKADDTIAIAGGYMLSVEHTAKVDLTDEWLPLYHAGVNFRSSVLEPALRAIGLRPEDRWAIATAMTRHTKRFPWE